MKSLETVIPTQSYLLPGQEFCVGLPWERQQLPKHGLPVAPPPAPKANALDEQSLAADPMAGMEIGHCEIIRRLSVGSTKSLLAVRTNPDASTVLVVLKQLDLPESAFSDLQSHAQWMNYLQHTNLARVFPAEMSDEGMFWVSEFASGATLSEIANACKKAGKGVPAGLSLAIAHEAALALGALHAPPGVPHGFVHPESLCVTFEGTAKLLELGMFRVIAGRLLRPQALAEVAPYLSPEQVNNGQLADPRTDVFALAATLYECLAGQKLASSFENRASFVPPSQFNHALGKDLDAVVLKALDPDRNKRFASALDFAKALKSAASAYMWKPQQRADFVGDLFRTRRRRENVLLQSVDEHLARKRSSQMIPKVSALPPPPPPPTPVEVAQQAAPAADAGPKHTVSMRAAAVPKAAAPRRSHRTRTLALALTAAVLAFVAARIYPLDRIAYDALTPFVPEPIVIIFPKPKPPPAPEPAAAEEKADATKAEEKPVLVASADEKPKHAGKAHAKHAKSEAALPPWLRHGHH
jgi:serine/threonine-protein kinase